MILLKYKWCITIFTCVLVFFIAAFGGGMAVGKFFLSDKIAPPNDGDKYMIERRFKLLEELSTIATKASLMRMYDDYLVHHDNLSQIYEKCSADKHKSCVKPEDVTGVSVFDINVKKMELNNEFQSKLQLIKIFFSIHTHNELDLLAAHEKWWLPEAEPKFRSLLSEMAKDIDRE